MRKFISSSRSLNRSRGPAPSPPSGAAQASDSPPLEVAPALRRISTGVRTAHPDTLALGWRALTHAVFPRLDRNLESTHLSVSSVVAAAGACLSFVHSSEAVSQAASPSLREVISRKVGGLNHEEQKLIGSSLNAPPMVRDDTPTGMSREQDSSQGTAGDTHLALLGGMGKTITKEVPEAHGGSSIVSATAQIPRTVVTNCLLQGAPDRGFARRSTPLKGSPAQVQPSLRSPSSVASLVNGPNNFLLCSSTGAVSRGKAAFGIYCDSPQPFITPRSLPASRPLSTHSLTPSAADIPISTVGKTPNSTAANNSIHRRSILIIGSTYRRQFRRTNTMYSANTLQGVVNDMIQLTEVFEARGYSVKTVGTGSFGREVLAEVARFVEQAEKGDVRAIAFTGHGHIAEDGTNMPVPPNCPARETAITQAEWEVNIKTHAKPGTIIFSIMAHCFSGDFMKQNQDCQSWVSSKPICKPLATPRADRAAFITFTSSSCDQRSFESTVEREFHDYAMDHFVYALVEAMKSAEADSWGAFFTKFEKCFSQARSCASWAVAFSKSMQEDAPGGNEEEIDNLPWRPNNLQTPTFSASEMVEYCDIF